MKRFPLTPNHGSEQPCRMIIYDTESYQSDIPAEPGRVAHSLRLGVASLWLRNGADWQERERLRFYSSGTFWEFVYRHCRLREPLWIYAHNAAFDFTLVNGWGELDCGQLTITRPGRTYTDQVSGEERTARPWHGKLAVDNLPFIIEAESGKGTVKLVDTLNYVPVSLDKLASWVGMAKVPLPDDDDSEGLWWERCERDVDITAAAVLKLMGIWRDEYLGVWQPTIARLAFSAFRHLEPFSGVVTHGDEDSTPAECGDSFIRAVRPPLSAKDVSRIERRAYYGGRTRVAFMGDVVSDSESASLGGLFKSPTDRPAVSGPVTVFDVNGLYAHVMHDCDFPVELMAAEEDVPVSVAMFTATNHPCIAEVSIDTRTHAYPVKHEGRTIYARGRYQTCLAGPELVRAFGRGHVTLVHSLLSYYSGKPFVAYVDYWWNKRLRAIIEGDYYTAQLAKLMINALYGKLGQRAPKWTVVDDMTPPIRWGGFVADRGDGLGWRKFRAVAGVAQESQERRDCRHTATAVSAFVTSYGRTYMETLWNMTGDRGCIYQDTDSLFVLPSGLAALERAEMLHPTERGKLKNEGTYAAMSIYGPKNYDKGEVAVAAGLKGKQAATHKRIWNQWHFERCNSLIGRQPDGTVHMWQQVFAAPGSTPGFSVREDGWTVQVALGE